MVVKNGACPMQPNGGTVTSPVPVTPVISVRSVNGEIGDVVLRNLVIGEKEYNGSERIEIFAKDLGLDKTMKYQRAVETTKGAIIMMGEAKVGDIYFCREDKLFYFSTGEGDYRTFGSGEAFKDYARWEEVASQISLEFDPDTLELSAVLFDKKGNKIYESEKVALPIRIEDIIKEGYYDELTKELVFVLKDGREIRIPVSGLLDGLQPLITEENKLQPQLVEGLPEFEAEISASLLEEVNNRVESIANETAARNIAIEKEVRARKDADSTEKLAREAADAKEASERIGADQALEVAINQEILNRDSADNILLEKINQEISDREEGDRHLDSKLTIEVTERTAQSEALAQGLATEVETRQSLTDSLRADLDFESSTRIEDVRTLTNNLTTERNNRISNVTEIKAAATAETDARVARDIELTDLIDDEAAARESNDELLQAGINKEIEDRQMADHKEEIARKQKDTELQEQIDSEVTTRSNQYTELSNKLYNEEQQRIINDNTLANMVDNLEEYVDEQDANLQDQINRIATYSVIKDETPMSEQYSATYHLTMTKDGVTENVGVPINIAKDFLVKEAHLRTVTQQDVPYPGAKVGDKYIDLVINVKAGSSEESHIYLPVQDLVDVYKGDGSTIAVDPDYTIHIHPDFLTRISNDEAKLDKEILDRAAEDEALYSRLHDEVVTETEERTAADTAIDEKFTAAVSEEATKRALQDGALSSRIDAEQTARQNDVAALQQSDVAILEDLASEMGIRETQDGLIRADLTQTNSNLSIESTTRESADNSLQSQIDAINARKNSFSTIIEGTGSKLDFSVLHALNSKDVIVQLYDLDSGETVYADVIRNTVNTITIKFKNAPEYRKQYKVLVMSIASVEGLMISFNANGGEGTMVPKSATAGIAFLLPICTFTAPAGKEFDCWAIGSPAGEQHAPGETYIFTDSTMLYAIWKNESSNIFYGATTDVPTSEDARMELIGAIANEDDLVANGAFYRANKEQGYHTVIIAKTLNIKPIKTGQKDTPHEYWGAMDEFIPGDKYDIYYCSTEQYDTLGYEYGFTFDFK